MPADVAPLVADGGNIRLVRRVAAYAYGSREVTWPEGAEDPKDELPDGREFGWVAQLAGPRPGLSGRRFVRADAVIDAVEGVSNTEQLLDDAAERTGGDVHFETLITGRGLAGQEPGVDFALGDRVPARFWGRILPGQLVTEVGWEEDGPYVKLGGQILRDLDALARARAELTRTIRKEREETAGAVESVRSYADSAVSRERVERESDVAQVREVLGGARADETVLVSQLAAVQAQISGMVGDGETPPPAGLLNSYLWMNTRLWEAQQRLDAAQDELIHLQNERMAQIEAAQRERVEADRARVNVCMATSAGATHPNAIVVKADDGTWELKVSDSGYSVLHVEDFLINGNELEKKNETLLPPEPNGWVLNGKQPNEYTRVTWAKTPSVVRSISRSVSARVVSSSVWETVLDLQLDKGASDVALMGRVSWSSAVGGSMYGVRLVSGGTVLDRAMSSILEGAVAQTVHMTGVPLDAGQVVSVQVYSTNTWSNRRAVSDITVRGSWVESV